jgi:hypothetical protein
MDSPSSQVDYLQQEEEEWFYDMPYTPIMRPDAASCTGVVRRIGIFTGVLSFFGSLYITNALYGKRLHTWKCTLSTYHIIVVVCFIMCEPKKDKEPILVDMYERDL